MKLGICEFREETCSFNPVLCDMAHFEHTGIYAGEDMFRALRGKPCAVGGMLRACEEAHAQTFPIYSMNANSSGIVDSAALEHFLKEAVSRLEPMLPLDGLLVSLHGATQTTTDDDACGAILERLRGVVGNNTVIAASCDLHANVTARMLKNADYISGYQTYPHVDYFETGYRAASLALAAINGSGAKLASTHVPFMAPPSSYTTLRGPFGELMAYAKSLVASGKLVDVSIFNMQPWMDVSVAASTIVAVAQDEADACKYASDLAKRFFDIRNTYKHKLFTIDEVIAKAEANRSGRPIILVDAADSSNAGACGDSPAVIERILARGSKVKAAIHLNDAAAVDVLFRAGVPASIKLQLGASMCDEYYKPVSINVKVRSLHDGHFVQEGPAGKGMHNHLGRTAVLSAGNIDILVCESTSAPGDPQLFRHFGIEPSEYQLVAVKACTSFRAAYEKIALEICETDTPGVAPIRLERLNFKKLPMPFFPFASIDDYVIPEPVISKR